MVHPYGTQYGSISENKKTELPYHPAISILGICPNELKVESQRHIHIPMFAEALFLIAKRWKQPKSPSTDAWIKKIWMYV